MVAQYLVADVGGTNTRVALASDGKLQIESIKSYRNSDQSGVDTILQKYLLYHYKYLLTIERIIEENLRPLAELMD